ncbi:helix-turn-helix transcriptional regulator [Fictibacillus sp. 5RED26]|uniref:helix-turn-helix domain-containing protein n=1 Tax=Fictibacillus sp. 5RED26 TaxID=2745876 RepID=UPI0018CF44FD|nr:helix-turn-helix transcriptional regulator [Fictibacillus sp. 5RED26]MBH0159090.1 helix-turn-helix transcriptional regulator [Fictibacillus sp. 5RED26]
MMETSINEKNRPFEGNRLAYLRKKRKLKVDAIIKRLGCGRSTYTNYELGYRSPKAQRLNLLADIFETSTDFILGHTDDETPNKDKITDARGYVEAIRNAPKLTFQGEPIPEDKIDQLADIIEIFLKQSVNK